MFESKMRTTLQQHNPHKRNNNNNNNNGKEVREGCVFCNPYYYLLYDIRLKGIPSST